MPRPRLEFTPQSKQSLCPSQMQVSGVGLPSCAIQCHQEPEGVLPPGWPGGWQETSLAEPPQLGHGPSAPTLHRTCPPLPLPPCANWAGAGQGAWGGTEGELWLWRVSGCSGDSGIWSPG